MSLRKEVLALISGGALGFILSKQFASSVGRSRKLTRTPYSTPTKRRRQKRKRQTEETIEEAKRVKITQPRLPRDVLGRITQFTKGETAKIAITRSQYAQTVLLHRYFDLSKDDVCHTFTDANFNVLMKNESLDRQALFQCVVKRGLVNKIKILMQDKRVNPAAKDNETIITAVQNNHLDVINVLLADKRVNPAAQNNQAIRDAPTGGIAKRLLADKRVDPTERDHLVNEENALDTAIMYHKVDVVKTLLADARVRKQLKEDPDLSLVIEGSDMMKPEASEKENAAILKLLLEHIDPSWSNQWAIRAVQTPSQLKVLLADPRVDPSVNNQEVLFSHYKRFGEVKTGLKNIKPTQDYLRKSHIHTRTSLLERIKLLLNNSRVDPSARNNTLIHHAASAQGDVDIVKILLKDKRVDPTVNSNSAIALASKNGHIDVVRLLLSDVRVDPTSYDHYALTHASKNGYEAIVALLLAHPRVHLWGSLPVLTHKRYTNLIQQARNARLRAYQQRLLKKDK